jgi:hypothetical protein
MNNTAGITHMNKSAGAGHFRLTVKARRNPNTVGKIQVSKMARLSVGTALKIPTIPISTKATIEFMNIALKGSRTSLTVTCPSSSREISPLVIHHSC